MSDPRTTPFSGRIAHASLKGQVEAERFVEGDPMQVASSLAPLVRKPGGRIDRTLILGRGFRVLDTTEDEQWLYGFAEIDGYCGWLNHRHLTEANTPTHRVGVRESYMFSVPDLKANERSLPLYFGTEITVTGAEGAWSRFDLPGGRSRHSMYLPTCHIVPVADVSLDPVAEARKFLGSPYVWGGNSGRGIDCSGLVQAAYFACGQACPGDSDLQEGMQGEHLEKDDCLRPGDLIFWEGHVAMATGPDTMIHANAHHMSVVEEPIEPALARIAATETGPVTLRLRPSVD